MVNRRINYDGQNKAIVLLSISILFLSVLTGFLLINKVKAENIKNTAGAFYTEIFNYTLPAVKAASLSEGNVYKNTVSLKKYLLSCVGFEISDAGDILKKEVSCFNNESSIEVFDESNTPENFKLDNKDVTINNEEDNTQGGSVQVVDPALKKILDPSKPEVFIYHTHTTESYKPSAADNIDPSKNVCAVGDELAKELQDNYGIAVVHDKTIHNVEAYNKSYYRSAETVQKYLNQYKNFKMVIDIHRDSGRTRSASTINLNGENVARFQFVMSQDNNPHYKDNISLVNSLVEISNKDFKGLLLDENIHIYHNGVNSFNQSMNKNAFLIEVGCDQNELSEAKATAKYLARIFAEQINGKK